MQITPIKTGIIKPLEQPLRAIIDAHIPQLTEGSVLIIASKIVSMSEGSVADPNLIDKDTLIKNQAHVYLDRAESAYNTMHTITKNSLMLAAGIDNSNSAGTYVLWPRNPLQSAKEIYDHCVRKYKLTNFGVLIADSTSKPLRLGTTGISLAHYGFSELNDYIGSADLFGKKLEVSRSNVAEGIASAAVLVMGEGTEQTPLAVASDMPFVQFSSDFSGSCYDQPADAYLQDVYEPFWKQAKWRKGQNGSV